MGYTVVGEDSAVFHHDLFHHGDFLDYVEDPKGAVPGDESRDNHLSEQFGKHEEDTVFFINTSGHDAVIG